MRTNHTMHIITHKAVTTVLVLGIFATTPLVTGYSAHAEESGTVGGVLQGSVIKTKQTPDLPTVNANDIKEIAPGTTLDMVISTAVATGVNVSGDEFFGKVSKDYTVDGKVVIPKGTIVHGLVQTMEGPKRAGRNGYISTKFDYMITPDG